LALHPGNSIPGFPTRFARIHPPGHENPLKQDIQEIELVTWALHFTNQAQKDARKLAASGLKSKTQDLPAVLTKNPYQTPPPYEKLVGDLTGAYSRRINIHHRLVYQVLEEKRAVKVLRMWTHYE
jgi:Txe/YoeB family toxin of toxin-antitoxin system